MNPIHRDAVVVDCHNDLPVMLVEWWHGHGRPNSFGEDWVTAWRAGGVDVQVLPIYLNASEPIDLLRKSLLLIEQVKTDITANSQDVALCLNGAEIDAAVAAGKIAAVLALEGCSQVQADVALFRTFYQLGIRMASFTHFERTLLADGSAEDATGGRLPRAGVAAIAEMERLGMLVDVSHVSLGCTEHILEVATRPVIASHSGARALWDHHRNLTDKNIKAIAATGGVVGVVMLPVFIDADNPSIDRVVDHMLHVASLTGVDHVGIGPDFIKDLYDTVYPQFPEMRSKAGTDIKHPIPDLWTTRHLPNVTEAMLRRGFGESEVKQILGGNFLRVFRQVMGVPG